MRLIDAETLEQKFIQVIASNIMAEKIHGGFACDELLPLIQMAKAVDAVPVVRCKECIFEKKAEVNSKGYRICPASGMEITDDDFCSYGERRADKV